MTMLASKSPAAASAVARPAPPTAQRIEELGRIILAYSEVTERLQRSHDQLQQTVEGLRRELGEKNRLLERSNRLAALGEMAAGMAHEIRNPLGGIQLYASLLARDLADRPESLRLVSRISGGVRRLEALVSQVLQFTREIRAAAVPADLAEVIDQAVDLCSAAMGERKVRCVSSGPRPLPVEADPVLLGQAMLNLLLNAADAIGGQRECGGGGGEGECGEGECGEVRITWQTDAEHQVRLSVEDTGPGIPADLLDKVFNPFFTTKETGTGLGLAIVHRIVEAHDGTISVSNVEGGGARFEIRIRAGA